MAKNPFDLALYAQLLWTEKPGTVLEIGSLRGGSALWFADHMVTFGLRPNVISIDLNPVTSIVQEGVRFLAGDARNLGRTLSPAITGQLPRPWFVVEDSSHAAATCRLVLDFFHAHLMTGEYIVIEDGIVTNLGIADSYQGGPSYAVSAFLAENPGAYQIDERYCDRFGYNFTYNINGYLRRL
jgi:cephalosporin hydroxylase